MLRYLEIWIERLNVIMQIAFTLLLMSCSVYSMNFLIHTFNRYHNVDLHNTILHVVCYIFDLMCEYLSRNITIRCFGWTIQHSMSHIKYLIGKIHADWICAILLCKAKLIRHVFRMMQSIRSCHQLHAGPCEFHALLACRASFSQAFA
jgi:hypothetical protein